MNFHPELYRWMLDHAWDEPGKAQLVQNFLTVFSEIERQYYPVNAKYHQVEFEKTLTSYYARTAPMEGLTETFRTEVRDLHSASLWVQGML